MGWFYVFILIPNPEVDLEAVEKVMEQESCCVETVWTHNATETIYKCIKNKDGIYAVLCGGGEKVYSFGQDKTYADGCTPLRYAEIPVMDAYDWDRWAKQNKVLELTKWQMTPLAVLAQQWPKSHSYLGEPLQVGIVAFLLCISKAISINDLRITCVRKVIVLWNHVCEEPTKQLTDKEEKSNAKKSEPKKDTKSTKSKDKERRRSRSRDRRRKSRSRSRSRPRIRRSRSRSNSRSRRTSTRRVSSPRPKRRSSPDSKRRRNSRSRSKDRNRRRSKERRRSPVRRRSSSRERNKKRQRSRSRDRKHR